MKLQHPRLDELFSFKGHKYLESILNLELPAEDNILKERTSIFTKLFKKQESQ